MLGDPFQDGLQECGVVHIIESALDVVLVRLPVAGSAYGLERARFLRLDVDQVRPQRPALLGQQRAHRGAGLTGGLD